MREGLVIDHSRADAGEAAKDIASPGAGLAMHRRVDKALDDPEFALKQAMARGMADAVRLRLEKRASIPSWLAGYVHYLKGGRVGSALTQAALAQARLNKAPTPQLRQAAAKAWAQYRTELVKVIGAYTPPVAAAGYLAFKPEPPTAWDRIKSRTKAVFQ